MPTRANTGPSRRRVAIVEDDDDLRLLMLLWLSPLYDCAGFSSGEALMSAIGHLEPHLFILDVALPGVSGFDVAGAFLGDGRLHGVPILFLTGLSRSDAEREIRRHPRAGYLSKPFERDRLQETVARILAQP